MYLILNYNIYLKYIEIKRIVNKFIFKFKKNNKIIYLEKL